MPQVFISYRREDTAGVVGRLYDRLAARFGERSVFLDVDTIPRGADFREQMIQAVRESDVFLLMIGKNWLGKEATGSRIMSTGDYVRLELEAAFDSAVPVIPVLIDGAAMPTAAQLPDSLSQLPYLNAAELRMGPDFRPHTERLIGDIEKATRASHPQTIGPLKGRARWWVTAVAISVTMLIMAAWLLPKWIDQPQDKVVGTKLPASETPANRVSANAELRSAPDVPETPIEPGGNDSAGIASSGLQSGNSDPSAESASKQKSQEQASIEISSFDPHRDLSAYGIVDLRQAMALFAQRIAAVLREQGTFQVTVGAFQGPAQLAASGGPCLRKLLREELEHRGIDAKARADWGITGRYHIVNAKVGDEEVLAVEILVRLEDAFGRSIENPNWGREDGHLTVRDNTLRLRVLNEREVCHLGGASVVLPPQGTPQERSQRLLEALRDPILSLDNNRLRAGRSSPYAVAFRSGGQVLQPDLGDSVVLLPLADLEQFEIMLFNDSDYHAAALVTIDGLNVFDFTKMKDANGRPQFQEIIIRPHNNALLSGWHITHTEAWPFSVKSFPDSAAALLQDGPDFGTVTVTFSAAWPPDSGPPPDEPNAKTSSSVGAGQDIAEKFAVKPMKFGVVRAAVSARYEKP